MAAEVGLAFLSASLQVLFDRLASPNVVSFVKEKKFDPELVPKLKGTLRVVGALLNDAENKQIEDDNVKNWLDDVRDAVYEADDLLDELSTKAATQSEKEVSNFFSFLNFQDRDNMGPKIADIIKRLDELEKQKDALGLKNTVGEKLLQSQRPQSTSLLEASDVCGRDNDKEAIITLLLSDDMGHSKIGVLPIVGMGGIGKTTLAQLVYNDDKVRQKFDLFAWVCVSEEFHVFNITKTVLEVITSRPCHKTDLDSLQLDLKEHLKEKKFFIVLDDAWNDKYDDWHCLMTPFGHASEGSKLIVTTRSQRVALVIGTVPFYPLGLLSDEDCLLIFTKHASLSKNPTLDSYLEKNGRSIIDKCKGLPLAAKLLGGLFRSQPGVGSWDIILKNNIWESFDSKNKNMPLPALRISYHYLPPHLKRCFVHCSLFPKDYEFKRDELILLWMAEDLLQPMNGNVTLKEVGDMYFGDLMSRSFFQHSSIQWDADYFVMHDLVHDLATFFAGKFYGISKIDQQNNIVKETRHMSYGMLSGQIELTFSELNRTKALRTFLCLRPLQPPSVENVGMLLNLKGMRVLSLPFVMLEILPESICELIHLRYLDLSHTNIQSLPDSVGKLHNLQTLKLRCCEKLTMLPNSIQDLVNLRFLDVRFTPFQAMPGGIGKLKNLHYLSDFIFNRDQEARIEELGHLPNIGGNLCISHLEYVSSGEEASLAKMLDKKHLERLELIWASDDDMLNSATERDILDKLQPHSNLRKLCIVGYRGTRWPDWFGLQDMTQITLKDCKNCYSLPPLGQLPSLKYLEIEGFDKMVSIETEFYNRNKSAFVTPFPSLKYLTFYSMPAWEEWCLFEMGALPRLQQLSLVDCPKLVGYLPKHLPALTFLRIRNCQQLASGIPKSQLFDHIRIHDNEGVVLQAEGGAILVKSLSISKCKKLEFPNQVSRESLKSLYIAFNSLSSFPMDGFPNLEELEIRSCENLESIIVSQSELPSIIIKHKPNLESLSRGLHALNMTHLTLFNCPKLKSLPLDMDKLLPNLKKLDIRGCQETEWHREGDMPPHLTHLTIDHCVFAKFSKKWGLPNLIDLRINGKYDNGTMQCFPEQGLLLPSSLTTLCVRNIRTLDTLECNGFLHLTSLRHLSISKCPKLEKIAGERLPCSIKELGIQRCPLLEEQCRMKNAEIWTKISHIPTINEYCRWW